MKKFGYKRYRKRKIVIVLAAIILLVGTVIGVGFKTVIGPNLDAVSKVKARGIVSQIINSTIEEGFTYDSSIKENDLLIIKYDKEGNIIFVEANTPVINKLVSGFAQRVQEKYKAMEVETVSVPCGTLLGSKVLSQSDYSVDIRVLPMSIADYEFDSMFVSEGINQTKYKVYVKIKSIVRVIAPFSNNTITAHNNVLIAEAIIVGEVPDQYIVVPDDEILDASQQ